MFDYYQIKEGDTLEIIAKKFNTNIKTLQEMNHINSTFNLRTGMNLVIPKNKEKYFTFYTIEKGDSLYKIAEKFNINPKLLSSLNGLDMEDYIYPLQEILIPKSNYSYYITADGDSLDTVANIFKVSKGELLTDNGTIYLLKDQVLVTKRK